MYTTTVPIIVDTHFQEEHLFEELQRCKADRVAFALNRELDYEFSSPENLEKLQRLIALSQEKGFEVVVWIGETLGHDQVTQYPQGWEEPYRRMQLPNKGTVASFCPTDERFTQGLCRWVGKVAQMRPDLIMLDDDFRLNGGCCCSTHVEWMNREIGETLTAEEWKMKAFQGGANPYRDVWIKVQGETLYRLATALRNAVDEVNPNQRMGVCASYYLWDADGIRAQRLIQILAGKTKPFLRTFGAPYHSYNDGKCTLGMSLEMERCQIEWCRDWEIELITEGDTYPRPRFYCPASYLECFDQVLRADGKANGILKYALDYCSDVYYERGYADAWHRNLNLYSAISKSFSEKRAVGVVPYLAEHILRDGDLKNAAEQPNFKVLHYGSGGYKPSFTLPVMNNLPTAYGGTGAKIIFGEHARHIPAKELNSGCILDITAAEILIERGIDVGILPSDEEGTLKISYLGGMQQYFREEDEYVRVSGKVCPRTVSLKENARVLTEFVSNDVRLPGWVRYENEDGQRFLIFLVESQQLSQRGMENAGYLNGYALRRMLLAQVEWLNRAPLDAYAEGNHPYLYTLVKKDAASLSVGVWNLFEDKISDLSIRINGTYSSARFINCEGTFQNGKVVLTTVLYPYEFAGIELLP